MMVYDTGGVMVEKIKCINAATTCCMNLRKNVLS